MFRSGVYVARAAVQGNTLTGYAAVFGVPTDRQGQFPGTETIARGAFTPCLEQDTLLTQDHNPGLLLARTSSGTLRLSQDDHGLYFEADLPATTFGNDIRVMVERGDLNGASFMAAFDPATMERTESGVVHNRFTRLVDVCVTALPAYVDTALAMRTASEHSLRGQAAAIRARVLLGGK